MSVSRSLRKLFVDPSSACRGGVRADLLRSSPDRCRLRARESSKVSALPRARRPRRCPSHRTESRSRIARTLTRTRDASRRRAARSRRRRRSRGASEKRQSRVSRDGAATNGFRRSSVARWMRKTRSLSSQRVLSARPHAVTSFNARTPAKRPPACDAAGGRSPFLRLGFLPWSRSRSTGSPVSSTS